MSKGATIISFKDVDFQHQENKPVLIETSFSIRRGAKLTLMGKKIYLVWFDYEKIFSR